jgi:hypothetical protein
MPKRIVDGEGLWRSGKLARVEPIRARAEYANLIPLALANGSFECSARLIWAQVYAFNRPDVTPEDVENNLKAFEESGLLFRWTSVDGKPWAYFVGIDKPGRLPGKSRKGKNEKIGAEPPPEALRKFLESKNFPGFGFGSGSGFGFGIGSGGKEGAPESGAPTAQDKPRPSPSAFAGLHLTVSQRQDLSLAEAFPWVDRQAEYRKADAWIEANPERRPRKTARFIHNWCSKIASPSSPRKEELSGKEFAAALAKNSGLVQ